MRQEDSGSLGGYQGGYFGEDESLDSDSIATSMVVEVASVDEDGSYIGYGGNTPPANEIEEDYDNNGLLGQSEADSSKFSYHVRRSHSSRILRSPGAWVSGESSHDDGTTCSFQCGVKTMGKSIDSDQGRVHTYSDSFASNSASQDHGATSGLEIGTSTLPEDGYDGASEKGRNDDDVDMVDDDVSHSEAFATGAEPFLEKREKNSRNSPSELAKLLRNCVMKMLIQRAVIQAISLRRVQVRSP